MKNFFKKFRDLERNASWKGQIIGLFLFYICFKVVPVIVIIVVAIIFGDGHYLDLGTALGLISGCYVYYKVLRRYPKKTVNEIASATDENPRD